MPPISFTTETRVPLLQMAFTSRLAALRCRRPSNVALPQLRYPIERPYQWRWLPYAVYGFMLIVLAILIPANYALQGYETVVTYEPDPNTTSVQWYHVFTGKPMPGSQCDAHLFNPGDTFTTSVGILTYTVQPNPSNTSDGLKASGITPIPYKGISTDFCDATQVGLQLQAAGYSVVGTASIQCFREDFQLSATTSIKTLDAGLVPYSPPYYLGGAGYDILIQPLTTGSVFTNGGVISNTEQISTLCPMSRIKNESGLIIPTAFNGTNPLCTPPEYNQSALNLTTMNVQIIESASGQSAWDPFVNNAVANFMEIMVAVVRYDLGSRLPSNFLVNLSAVLSQNLTFLPINPATHSSMTLEFQQGMQAGVLPIAQPFDASAPLQSPSVTLSTTYQCHLTVPKPPGAATVSILVATLSIGGTIWGLLMLTVRSFATPDKHDAICCECHNLESRLPKSLDALEECPQLKDDAVDELEITTTGIGTGASSLIRVAPQDATTSDP